MNEFDVYPILSFIDYTGTIVFAISGAMTAVSKRMDIFGVSTIAFVTALGGGTLRDILIGNTPVSWMQEGVIYLGLVTAGIVLALSFSGILGRLRKTLFLFDTIGIAVFTILGLQKCLDSELTAIISVLMGVVSAVFGGVLRDVLCNEIPLIFRKEIYALTCLSGGFVYLGLGYLEADRFWQVLVAVLVIISIRILAVVKKWQLPTIK